MNGNIEYSEGALVTIITEEAKKYDTVFSVNASMAEEDGFYRFKVELTLRNHPSILQTAEAIQLSALKMLQIMTELENIKIDIFIKNIVEKKIYE